MALAGRWVASPERLAGMAELVAYADIAPADYWLLTVAEVNALHAAVVDREKVRHRAATR